MDPTWKACTCSECSGSEPAHALWDVADLDSGDRFNVAVPWEHRDDPIGWGNRRRAFYRDDSGEEVAGLVLSEGEHGVMVRGKDGQPRPLGHGHFSLFGGVATAALPRLFTAAELAALVDPQEMAKGADIPAGSRWITVHPNGPGTDGHAILITPHPDGTFRVIGGAGGKLNHLILHGVKPPQTADEKKASDQKRAEKEKARKAALSTLDIQEEQAKKDLLRSRKRTEERTFVDAVRKAHGGIDDDIPPAQLDEMTDKARKKVIQGHHRKQLRQAKDVVAKAKHDIVEAQRGAMSRANEVRQALREDPDVAPEIVSLTNELVEMDERARRERAEERKARARVQTRQPGFNAWTTDEDLDEVDALVTDTAKALGADDVDAKAEELHIGQFQEHEIDPKLSAVDHVRREGVRQLVEARTLLGIARGTADRADPAVAATVARLAEEAGVDQDDGALAHAAMREAGRRAQRAELAQVELHTIQEIDKKSPEKAWKQIQAKTAVRKVARDVEDLRRLGMTDAQEVPIRDWEASSLVDVLRSEHRLKSALRALDDLAGEAEGEDFARSRDAWQLSYQPPAEELVLGVEDEMRTQLAGDLVRMMRPGDKEMLGAAAHGRYDALADAALALSGTRHVDRTVVDALGLRNAALLSRHAMEMQGIDVGAASSALDEHHVATQIERSQAAIDRANTAVPELSHTIHEVGDIETALSHLDAHAIDIADAQNAIGTALGQLEGTAALAQAFREPKLPDALELPVEEHGGIEQAIAAAQAAGWRVSDLAIDREKKTVSIPRAAWGRVLRPVDAATAHAREQVQQIKKGAADEEHWLPHGFYRRAASTFTNPVPEAPRSFEPLALGSVEPGDYRSHIEDHVARRLADGEDPTSIHRDLMSAERMAAAGDTDAYTGAVRELFPLTEAGGDKITPFDAPGRAGHWQAMVERHLARTGNPGASLHSQAIDTNDVGTRDAVLRTLVEHPHAAAAFKSPDELTRDDRGAIRDAFYAASGVPRETVTAEAAWNAAEATLGPEPRKESVGLFGGGGISTEWQEWSGKRDQLLMQHPWIDRAGALEAHGPRPEVVPGDQVTELAAQDWDREHLRLESAKFSAQTPWQKYLAAFPTEHEGIAAMQAELRGTFASTFREHYGRITGQPLRAGAEGIPSASTHLRGLGRAEDAEALAAELRGLQAQHARLRERQGGKFAAEGEGAVKRRYAETAEEDRAVAANQGALFGAPTSGGGLFGGTTRVPAPAIQPERGQRWSLGARVEGQLGSLVNSLGDAAKGKPAIFPDLNMDGGRIDQQRAIKAMQANGGTLGGYLGPGSGKTFIMAGAATEAMHAGLAQHAVITTPAKVVEQFPGELASALEPGKYKTWTATGKSYDERIAALKDTGTHFKVFGHEAMRDTLVEMMQRHHGKTREEMLGMLREASPKKRAQLLAAARDGAGIRPWFMGGDEAHKFTYRDGDESGVNLAMQAAFHPLNSTQRIASTGTPHKNDEKEVWSMAAMLDPDNYGDRAQFLHNFGKNLQHRPDAIRRETEHLVYQARIPPEGVHRLDVDNPTPGPDGRLVEGGPIPLHPEQQKAIDSAHAAWTRASEARRTGGVDVDAIKQLAPARFEGVPEAEHEKVARAYQEDMGVGIRDVAVRRAINSAPIEHNPKLQHLVGLLTHQVKEGVYRDKDGKTQKGKPSIVFSDWKDEVRLIHQELSKAGLRVATVTGDDSAEQAQAKHDAYQRGEYDVVVGTKAIEAGGNWQRAKSVVHYDVPQTWMSHQQRSGRAFRIKQKGDVDIVNLHTSSDFEQAALRRLRRKKGLSGVFEDPLPALDETGLAAAYSRQLRRKTDAVNMAA